MQHREGLAERKVMGIETKEEWKFITWRGKRIRRCSVKLELLHHDETLSKGDTEAVSKYSFRGLDQSSPQGSCLLLIVRMLKCFSNCCKGAGSHHWQLLLRKMEREFREGHKGNRILCYLLGRATEITDDLRNLGKHLKRNVCVIFLVRPFAPTSERKKKTEHTGSCDIGYVTGVEWKVWVLWIMKPHS